jgi:hypothetical protein
MERQHIAYLLIAFLAIAISAWIIHARYNSRERTYRRRELRNKAPRKRVADRTKSP